LLFVPDVNTTRGVIYLVHIGNAFAEVEFGVFNAVASFDFDEGRGWSGVAFSAGERDVLAANV
jgi:hypothetical protein